MRHLILSAILLGNLFPFTVPAEQVLPEDLHSLPVLIQIPSPDKTNLVFCGTGVYLAESNKLFLITAAHVIFNFDSTNKLELKNSVAALSCFERGKDSTNNNLLILDLKRLMDGKLVRRHSSRDVAAIQIGTEQSANTNGERFVVWEHGVGSGNARSIFVTWPTSETCKEFKSIPDGNETYILGYPVELLTDKVPSEVDFSYPLIRKGIISQRNQKTGKLIIDSGVYGGNSGGPVLIVEHLTMGVTSYRIGGLITQFVPVLTRIAPQIGVTNSDLVNSGYSVAEPIDYALELMRQFP